MIGDDEEAVVFGRVHALGPCHPVEAVISALCVAAAVVIQRDAEWNYGEIRNAQHGPILKTHCFACGLSGVRLIRHHIVQIQNGGSNHYRNLIEICQHCHARIHPWLPKPIKGTDFVSPLGAVAGHTLPDE